jgi:hypothetical protein
MGDSQAQQLLVELDLIDKQKLQESGKVELKAPGSPDHQPVQDVLQGGSGFAARNDATPYSLDTPAAAGDETSRVLDTEEQVKELIREVEGR